MFNPLESDQRVRNQSKIMVYPFIWLSPLFALLKVILCFVWNSFLSMNGISVLSFVRFPCDCSRFIDQKNDDQNFTKSMTCRISDQSWHDEPAGELRHISLAHGRLLQVRLQPGNYCLFIILKWKYCSARITAFYLDRDYVSIKEGFKSMHGWWNTIIVFHDLC